MPDSPSSEDSSSNSTNNTHEQCGKGSKPQWQYYGAWSLSGMTGPFGFSPPPAARLAYVSTMKKNPQAADYSPSTRDSFVSTN
mmetsp:Transcript_14280/g.22023  ORF Transcript_14280/g.22023 Transcript_14280/m.22023 type:complete len:83 (+) Transcript_14280:78-326(+)